MGEGLDLAPDGLIGGFPHTRCAIIGPACNGDENILLGPAAFGEHLAQLLEVHLELAGAVAERGIVIDDAGVGFLPQANEVGAGAVEAVLHHIELQA